MAVLRVVSTTGTEVGVGGEAGGGALTGDMAPGGRVIAPRRGFSISMVPPHLAQRVFTLGRSPSFDSSNLYRAWHLGQTINIAVVLLTEPPHATAASKGLSAEDNRLKA
jgi:hypothetical protein